MKMQFIGTGAHDYSPLLKTSYKERLDKNIRRSSSVLFDGHLLIDCGDHTVESMRIQKIALKDVDVLLLTHLHEDHYCPDNIRLIAEASERKVQVYACKAALKRLKRDLEGANVEIHSLTYCKSKKLKCGFSITALPANHTCCASHYFLEKNEKGLYYGTDGAWIMYDTFYYLVNKKVDAMVLEATVGDYEGDYRVAEHNSIPMIRLMLKTFYNVQLCNENTRIILTHIAPSLHKSHEQEEAFLLKEGIKLAYDGLEIVI